MTTPNPIHVDGCLDAPLRRTLQEVAQAVQYLIDLGDVVKKLGDEVNNIKVYGTNRLAGKPANYYIDNTESEGEVPPRLTPRVDIVLTSDMAVSGGIWSAKAKLYQSNGSGTFAATGDEFNVYDVYERWWHAKSGDHGYVEWDSQYNEIGAFKVSWLDTLPIRYGTSAADLTSGGTVTIGGRTVYGDNVPTDYKIPSGARLTYYADHTDKHWIAIASNKCVVHV